MSEPPVLYERHGAVALISFNRPHKLNAFDIETLELFESRCRGAAEDDDVLAVVITGEGDRAFSAGGDLQELIPRISAGDFDVVKDSTKRFLSDCFKPVVAAVNGICTAGGLEILLGTDIRIASERATFGLGEVRWGVVPGAGSHVRLPLQVPWAIAMQLLLTGDPIDARRAYEVGLVNEVVPHGTERERALALADRLTHNGPLAMRTAKEIAVRALDLEPGFVVEHALTGRVMRSEDAKEGPRAFIERRPPEFTGR
jgi:enoyl-CoA hydratase